MTGWLGIDLGTGSVKAVVVDPGGAVVARASVEVPVLTPGPGRAESPPTGWWTATCEAVRAALDAAGRPVAGIGLSGQMHGVVLVDRHGRPLHDAVLWLDVRGAACLDAWQAVPAPRRAALANPLTAGMAGPILRWFARHRPEVLDRAAWALQPKDWLRLRLTGTAGTEPTDASATLLYDAEVDAWAADVAESAGIPPRLLPPLQPSDAIAGELTPSAAGELGLTIGLPVAAGAADTAAGILGSGLGDGELQLTVGSGAQLVVPQPHLDPDPDGATFRYRAVEEGRWYAMAAMQNAGRALEWARAVLGYTWDEAYADVATVPAGCGGVRFLPYLAGERTPHFDDVVRGAWVGLGLAADRRHLMRAAFEGVAFTLRDGLDALPPALAGPAVRVAGGGMGHAWWRQLVADVLGRALVSLLEPDVSGRGAALLGGAAALGGGMDRVEAPSPAAGAVTDPGDDATGYLEILDDWRRLYPTLV